MFALFTMSARSPILLTLLIGSIHFQTFAQTLHSGGQVIQARSQIQDVEAHANSAHAVENLTGIQRSIETKGNAVKEFRGQLKKTDDASEKQDIERKIERLRQEITGLELSFQQIMLGGIDLSELDEQPEQQVNWREELEQISRPILSTLKELTAKPRQMDSLRREIERREDQLSVIGRVLDSIRTFREADLPPETAERVNQAFVEWGQRRDDTERALKIAHFRLADLDTERQAWHTTAWDAVTEFLSGRGLTLLLAILIGIVIYLICRALLLLYWRWLYQTPYDIGVSRAPLVLYSYRLATAALIVVAVLIVFYVRGDVLLLTLAVIALAGAALSLRQTLPRYAAELRLLLGVGPVREGERLVYDGVPHLVESLGVYSVLRNPFLEGVVRLPLHAVNGLVSRPAGEEPWFPSQPGDYMLLPNGSFARVIRQTIEMVEVAIRDTQVQIPTSDFIAQNGHNLTRNGFGIATTFGIDYQHQSICLDSVPALLREAILVRFERADLREAIKNILVEFKSAGTSSLDYQIYLILDGHAANAFFRAQRLVQQACVETCNREGWVIPFTQVTVHSSVKHERNTESPSQLVIDTAAGVMSAKSDNN